MKYFKFMVCLFCMIIFLAISFLVLKYDRLDFDFRIYNAIISMKSDFWTAFFRVITFFASVPFLVFITILSLFIRIHKKYKVFISLNMVNDVILNNAFKYIIRRNRPLEWFLVNESGYSFPSGHAMGACCFYGLLIYLLYRSSLSNKYKVIGIIGLIILILLIGVSRIYLGVHYATDVIGGMMLACAYLIIYITFMGRKVLDTKEKSV